MTPNFKLTASALLVLLLIALLAACAQPQPPLPHVVVPAATIPPLPQQARQPRTPEWCLPTCLDGWNSEVENSLRLLENAALPAPPASGPTMP